MAFLNGEGEIGVRKVEPQQESPTADGPARYAITVNGKSYDLAIDGDTATVNGKSYQVSLGAAADMPSAGPAEQTGGGTPVAAQMPGKVIRLLVQVGDPVETGDNILILEAMKMEMPVTAPVAGTITNLLVGAGEQVANEQVLAHIG